MALGLAEVETGKTFTSYAYPGGNVLGEEVFPVKDVVKSWARINGVVFKETTAVRKEEVIFTAATFVASKFWAVAI